MAFLKVAIKCNKAQVKWLSCHRKIQPIDFLPTREKHCMPLTTDGPDKKDGPENCRRGCPVQFPERHKSGLL